MTRTGSMLLFLFLSTCLGTVIGNALGLRLLDFEVVPVNSLFFNGTGRTNLFSSIYAEYRPVGGDPGKNSTYRSRPTVLGKEHTLFFSRLYARTTYAYVVYLTSTRIELARGTFVTGRLPPILENITVVVERGDPSEELIMASYADFSMQGNNYVYRWDETGRIVHYLEERSPYPATFGVTEDLHANIYVNAVTSIKKYTPWNTLDMEATTDSCPDFHHEAFLERNQRYLWTLNIELLDYEGVPQQGDSFVRWDLKHDEMKVKKKTSDFVDPSVRTALSDEFIFPGLYFPCKNVSVLSPQDWTHGNSLVKSRPFGRFMTYSSRSLNAVYIFDSNLHNLLYVVGGPESTFSFPDPKDEFSVQHTADVVDDYGLFNLKLLVFDNGVYNVEPYSRALLLDLNLLTKQATKIWEYRLSTNVSCLANFTGSAYKLDDGDYLVGFPTCDWNFGSSGASYVARLDYKGKERWLYKEFKDNGTWFTYRFYESRTIAGEVMIEDT